MEKTGEWEQKNDAEKEQGKEEERKKFTKPYHTFLCSS
jgi:hypothetical protein